MPNLRHLPLLALLAALPLSTTPAVARAQGIQSETKSAILTYLPGNAQRNGYESAGLWFGYHFAPCVGTSIQVMPHLVLIHFQANVVYWYNGKRMNVPATLTGDYRRLTPSQVSFRATLSTPGRMQEKEFVATARQQRCAPWHHTGVQQKDLWDEKATPEQKKDALARLSVGNGTTLEPLRNPKIEEHFARLEAEARTAERQKAAQARTDSMNRVRAARTDSLAAAQRAQSQRSASGASTGGTTAGASSGAPTASDPWGTGPGGSSGSSRAGASGSTSPSRTASADRPFSQRYARDNQGNHYRRAGNGQWEKVNQDEYNAALTAERQKVAQQNAASQRQRQESAAATAQANFQRQQQAAAERTARFERQSQALQQSFYAAQAVNRSRDNVRDLSQLDGNYSSAAELEADFQRRMAAVRQELQAMEGQQAQARQAGVQAIMGDAPEEMKQVLGAIGAIQAQRERDKQERLARERMQRQRTQLLAQMEQKRIAMMRQMRQTLVAQFPEGGVPLSFHKVQGDELYFFSYALDRNRLNDASPTISITNTFPVARLGDGSWPYKSSLNSELRSRTGGAPTLVGFYATRQLAESMRQSFVRIARESGMSVREVSYAGRPRRGGSRTAAGADAWSGSTNAAPARASGNDPWAPQGGAAAAAAPAPAAASTAPRAGSAGPTISWKKGDAAPPFSVRETETCSFRHDAGEFLLMNRGSRTCGTFRSSIGGDVRVRADLRLASWSKAASVGLQLGSVARGGQYVLSMDRRGNVRLFQWDGAKWQTHRSVTSTAVRTEASEVNEVVVQIAGLSLDVYVNGVHTLGHSLAAPFAGGVGFWANRAPEGTTEPTQVVFERLVVEPLR